MIMHKGEEKSILMDTYDREWTEEEWDGSDKNPVTVTCLDVNHYKIEAEMYYCSSGQFEMTITQPLERAIRTFMAAMIADSELETGVVEDDGRSGRHVDERCAP